MECIAPDPDGILDLSSLRLGFISLQGMGALVDEDTSKTKRTWRATKALLLAALHPDALGSRLCPLHIDGVPKPEAGGILVL